jgi:hypothetical protein
LAILIRFFLKKKDDLSKFGNFKVPFYFRIRTKQKKKTESELDFFCWGGKKAT